MQPDERDLEESIGAAFDRLPEPDSTRLREIEERLTRRASRPSVRQAPRWIYWGLLAGLAATGAAAWWGGQYLSRAPEPATVEQQPERSAAPGTERIPDRRAEPVAPAEPNGAQREIYRREMY